MRETFKDCGEIASVRFAEDRETGAFKGFGHVEFVESEATDKAVELAGMDVMGRAIRVDYANDRKNGGEWKLFLAVFMIDYCMARCVLSEYSNSYLSVCF